MYPFAGLPENLAAFCAGLRREHGFHVGPRELHDAARALEIAAIGDERAVRHVLGPILSHTVRDAAGFDEAFRAFFHPAPTRSLEAPVRTAPNGHADPGDLRSGTTVEAPEPAEAPVPGDERLHGIAAEVERSGADSAGLLRATYSPVASDGSPLELAPAGAPWQTAAALFVSRVETMLSRRWRPARHGPRFDLRRTLRSSLHTGAEPVLPRWQVRPRIRPKFAILVDGSRSMAAHNAPALAMAVAMTGIAPGAVDVFVFSTALQSITRDARRAAAGERRRLPGLRHAWGGGTGIGQCLTDFVRRYGGSTLGRQTVVMIASDGLDLGEAEILRDAMSELRRRSAAIIWLNPLVETAGYEPTALGMQVARPFVSTFGWAGDPDDLERLARELRVRRA